MAATRFVAPGALVLLLVSSCGHSEPFQDPDETNHGPFAPGAPLLLTYNPLIDATPAWLPGDSLLTYSFGQKRDASNEDVCLGVLPAGGGTRVSQSCPITAAALDSLERYMSAVPLNDSVVALVQGFRRLSDRFDQEAWLGTAPWRAAQELTPRKRFPGPSAGGFVEFSADFLSPLGGGQLAYLSMVDDAVCLGPDPFCDVTVLVRYGRMVSELNLADQADPVVLAGTEYATAVAPGRSPGALLFTLPFDPRVYERAASGAISVVIDFGASAVSARDPALAGTRLVAIVGGSVYQGTTSTGAHLQIDGGGIIAVVDLDSGQVSYPVPGGMLFRRPALSGNGQLLVAVSSDDLYQVDLP